MGEGKSSNSRLKSAVLKIAVIFFWLAVWEIISIIVGMELLVPSVLTVAITLADLVISPLFRQIAATTITRILVGFALGTILGSVLAVLTYMSKIVYAFFKPILSIIKATPIVSFIILALVWIKGGNIPSFISFLMVFPIVWGNVFEGIKQTDIKLLEMAKAYRIPKSRIFAKIYFHSVLPYLGAAATTSMGLAWKAGIAAEVIATPGFAIGTAIYDSKIYLETPELFAWSIVVIVISVILEKTVEYILGKITFGKESDDKVSDVNSDDIEFEGGEEYKTTENKGIFEKGKDFPTQATGPGTGITIKDLTVAYGDKEIIKGFNAALPSKGCVGISGVSGIGKTTLLNVIAGLKEAKEGRIEAGDEDMPIVSYVFQEDRLIPWISTSENVRIVLGSEDNSDEILKTLGLGEALNKYPTQLSGGMRQRVNIARALAYDAPVYILDEPFKGLDEVLKTRIMDIFDKLKESRLVILVTHDRTDLESLADRIIEIGNGNI